MRRGFPLAIAGVVVTADMVMLLTMGRAVIVLAAVLLLAFALSLNFTPAEPRQVLPAYFFAIVMQLLHLSEEYRSGFYRAFPPVFGAPAWSGSAFLLFNAIWLSVFGLGAYGLIRRSQWATVIAFFLALGGGVLNGLGHAVLAVQAGAYFPGLYTAPLVFVAGSVLAFKLLRSSRISVPAI
jgi:hypothetical protein